MRSTAPPSSRVARVVRRGREPPNPLLAIELARDIEGDRIEKRTRLGRDQHDDELLGLPHAIGPS
ncbi:hypothetical protein AKJ09_06184 [Labilithrix luteola]|uniref:Uncharacterized protein n=1 Tax=Labilithrix luteola TaxID=1391654 RepID=A0A0K1Q158_9BACT|nr:hypothetical protein AKJ09_06184 [Labilithrix luteola]